MLGIFDIRQPFNLNPKDDETVLPSPQNPEADKKMSLTHHDKKPTDDKAKFRTNKTEVVRSSKKESLKDTEFDKVKLPRISKSVGNLKVKGYVHHIHSQKKLSTSELWRENKRKTNNRKRALSDFGLISLIKDNHDATEHFELMSKLEKMSVRPNLKRRGN